MDDLQKAALVYNSLLRQNFSYSLSDGNTFEFFFAPKNFKHLIGLHKLIDIVLPQNKNTLYNRILNGLITIDTIKNSRFYSKIEDRIKLFPELKNMLFLNHTYEFDKSVIVCSLNTKYFFFNDKNGLGLYFGVAYENGKNYFYPETFFTRSHDYDYYIRNQKLLNVLSLEITPKYDYNHLLPQPLLSKLDAVRNIIGYSPSLNDILREIEGISTQVEVIGQQKNLLYSKEKEFEEIEHYLKTRDEAAAELSNFKGGFKSDNSFYNELLNTFNKMDKLFSLSGFKSADEFYKAYSQFLSDKDMLLLELDKRLTVFSQYLNVLYDAKSAFENHYHGEVITFYRNEYPGASQWTQKDTNLIRRLNERHNKALTLEELKQLPKSDEVLKVLNLFKDNSHNREIER